MPRAGRVSDDVAADWLADLAARSTYLGLATANPFGVADPLTVEVTGGGYSRVPVTWLTSARLLRNEFALAWVGIPPGTTVAYITGWNAAFNGDMSFATPYGPTLYAVTGGLLIPAEDFFVGLDA